MKICFINTNKAWGGGEKWHFQTSIELKKRGYDISMIAHKGSPLAQRIGQQIRVTEFEVGKLSFLKPLFGRRLKRFFQEEKFDAIILNLPADVKAFSKPAFEAGVRKVIYRRGMNHPIKASGVNKYFYRNFITDIIANSEDVKR